MPPRTLACPHVQYHQRGDSVYKHGARTNAQPVTALAVTGALNASRRAFNANDAGLRPEQDA